MSLVQLKWGGYTSNLLQLFESFLNAETLVDVTLAAEGRSLKAHRVILCACSSYFQDLISGIDKDKHPIIFLKGVKFSQLQTLVNFIYRGEIEIPSDELPSLLSVADELKIRGITDQHEEQPSGQSATSLSTIQSENTNIPTKIDQLPLIDPTRITSELPEPDIYQRVRRRIGRSRQRNSRFPRLTTKTNKGTRSISNAASTSDAQRPSTSVSSFVEPPIQNTLSQIHQQLPTSSQTSAGPKKICMSAPNSSNSSTGRIQYNIPPPILHLQRVDELKDEQNYPNNSSNISGRAAEIEADQDVEFIDETEIKIEMGEVPEIEVMNSDYGIGTWQAGIQTTEQPIDLNYLPPESQSSQSQFVESSSSLGEGGGEQNKGGSSSYPHQQQAGATNPQQKKSQVRKHRKHINIVKPHRHYTEEQKQNAIQLLQLGYSCRQVAALVGPECSSGTPIRWKQQYEQQQLRYKKAQAVLNKNKL